MPRPSAVAPLHLAMLALLIVSAGFIAASDRSAMTAVVSCSETSGGCATGESAVKDAVRGTAPDFTAVTLDGRAVTLSYLLAERPVILDFWASWCPHCQRAMPRLDALARELDGRVTVLGINMKEDVGTVSAFITERGITYPIVLDAGDIARAYGIRFTNTHVLIRQDGTIAEVRAGDLTKEDIVRYLGTE
jgi:thiol-disulfide isomerase/thioredoxin